jgi:uncharacterized protein with WD repeat
MNNMNINPLCRRIIITSAICVLMIIPTQGINIEGSADTTDVTKFWSIAKGYTYPHIIRSIDWRPNTQATATLYTNDNKSKVIIQNSVVISTGRNIEEDNIIWEAQWSPNGTWLANLMNKSIKIWTTVPHILGKGVLVKILDSGTNYSNHISWSPDGKKIAVVTENVISIWDVESGIIIKNLTDNRNVNIIAWSPGDDNIIASSGSLNSTDKQVRIWNLSAEIAFEEIDVASDPTSIDWTSNGSMLAIAEQDGLIRVLDKNFSITSIIDSQRNPLMALKWSPLRNYLTFEGENYDLTIWDIAVNESIKNLNGHQDTIISIDWSNDERYIISAEKYSDITWGINEEYLTQPQAATDIIPYATISFVIIGASVTISIFMKGREKKKSLNENYEGNDKRPER